MTVIIDRIRKRFRSQPETGTIVRVKDLSRKRGDDDIAFLPGVGSGAYVPIPGSTSRELWEVEVKLDDGDSGFVYFSVRPTFQIGDRVIISDRMVLSSVYREIQKM